MQEEVKGKLVNGVASQYPSHLLGTWCIRHYYLDVHTSAASNRLNWHPYRFKWIHPFCWKTKLGFCACAITFQMQSADCMKPALQSSISSLQVMVAAARRVGWGINKAVTWLYLVPWSSSLTYRLKTQDLKHC